jgi:type VI secretion system protein ImpG
MDPRLLRHYNQELQHLREMGAEFATQFPKIAARLRIDGLEVSDPHVERLLEGFAFLTARIQLKLDAEFPRFTQRLLEVLYPHFLAPMPSMLIARIDPDQGDGGLAAGVPIARGSKLRSSAGRAGPTECRFRTAHDVTLWPIEIAGAEYFSHAANLPLAARPEWRKAGGGLRITLRTLAGLDFSKLALDNLRLHCSASDEVAFRLHERVCGNTLGVFVMAGKGNAMRHVTLECDAIEAVGFDDDQALLPLSLRGFEGYRLLQEYFAFPQRFLFFDVCGLGDALRQLGGQELELVFLFARGDSALLQSVDAQSVSLHCVPAVNLFEHRCDRIPVSRERHDLHVVPDRVRPMDFEVHQIQSVTGYGAGLESERAFLPLYSAFHTEAHGQEAYFVPQREPRLMSTTQRRDGPRSSYIGSEVYLSIVDQREAPFADALEQLAVTATCSNRDLPLLMPLGAADSDLALEQSVPVASIRVVKGPSRPLSAQREGNVAWQLINQLSLNHVSLNDADAEHGAAALRELLRLHTHEADSAMHRQIEGLRKVTTRAVVRRLPMPGPIAFGRGVQIDLEVDELAFQGSSAYLFACVMERFFARHVSMNGFTETRMRSQTRGDIMTGRPRCGSRPIL